MSGHRKWSEIKREKGWSPDRPAYTALVTRAGRRWAIKVPEVAGCLSQARRLADVDRMARDAISLMLDVPPDSFHVRVIPVSGAEWLAIGRDAEA